MLAAGLAGVGGVASAQTPPTPSAESTSAVNRTDFRVEQRDGKTSTVNGTPVASPSATPPPSTGEATLAAVPAGCGDVDGVSTEFVRVTARHAGEFALVVKGEPVGEFTDFVDQSFPVGEGSARVDLLPVEGSGESVSVDVPDTCGTTPTPSGTPVKLSGTADIDVTFDPAAGLMQILIKWL